MGGGEEKQTSYWRAQRKFQERTKIRVALAEASESALAVSMYVIVTPSFVLKLSMSKPAVTFAEDE
jgi:hypothetical protein